MSDVATWDPVDESNTAAPPAGAPEGMQPSAVNNTLRAIQGAVRRMYDTFTAQFTALPTTYLHLTGGTLRDGIDIARFDTTGCYNQSGSWIVISDARAKQPDVQPYDKGLQAVLALRPVQFRYLDSDTRRYGLIAQEVEPVVPEMVSEALVGSEMRKAINPGHLHYIMLNAIKELAAENALLEARIATLEDLAHV